VTFDMSHSGKRPVEDVHSMQARSPKRTNARTVSPKGRSIRIDDSPNRFVHLESSTRRALTDDDYLGLPSVVTVSFHRVNPEPCVALQADLVCILFRT